jgi:hypothetical protein
MSRSVLEGNEEDLSGRMRRTTLVLPEIIARNVAIVCGKRKMTLNKYLSELIRADLSRKGLDPDVLPTSG